SVKLILLYFSKLTSSLDHAKISHSLDYLRHLNSFVLKAGQALPRAFSSCQVDKRPNSDYFVTFRFVLLAYYCTPQHYQSFRALFIQFSKLNQRGYSALNMMTSVIEIALNIFKSYKNHRIITKLKERLA